MNAENVGWDPLAFPGAAISLAQMTAEKTGPLLSILQNGSITTHFQPVFDRNLSLWGCECLMRAKGDGDNVISPAQLIDWAKQKQMVFMLDRRADSRFAAHRSVVASDERRELACDR